MSDEDDKGGYPLPATWPSTHTPTLPPRGPGVLRYLGVVIAVLCAAVFVVVVSLALFLPKKTPATAPVTTTTTTAPTTATATNTAPIEDLAPVPLSIGPNDVRANVERSMKRRGLRDGDVPAVDALVERAARLERAKRDVDALQARHHFRRVLHECGLVALSPMRFRREVGRVGLYHE